MAGKKGAKQKHRQHGLVTLRRALRGAIDPKSSLGLALAGMQHFAGPWRERV